MASAEMSVEVLVDLGPHRVERRTLGLSAGASAADAWSASGLAALCDGTLLAQLRMARWGRLCAPQTLLHDGDRVELLRPLQQGPMQARRLRQRRDGLKSRAAKGTAAT